MKFTPLLSGLSVGLNVALVAALVVGGTSASDSAPKPVTAKAAPVTAASAASANAQAATPGSDTWATLHGKNDTYAAQIARLQEAGFPPAVVRAIITAQIQESFAPQRKALADSFRPETLPPWKTSTNGPQYVAGMRALERESSDAIRAALGPNTQSGAAAQLRQEHPTIPSDKIDQIVAIRDRYSNATSDLVLSASGGGLITTDIETKLRGLEKTRDDEIAAALTPAELEDFNLRSSSVASSVRSRLELFETTAQEFREFYRIEAAYREASAAMNGVSSPTPEQMNQLRAASTQRDESIKALFTPERYADYQRATDSTYRNTARLTNRLGLPITTANEVYVVQKDIQARVTEAGRNNRTMEARNQAVAPLLAETESRITAILGASGYQAYREIAGTWMQTLTPRPAPNAPPVPVSGTTGVIRLGP